MRKIAWPYVGSTEHEMGSMAPKGDPDKDIQMESSEYDALSPEKSVIPDQEDPITNTGNGMISWMEVGDSPNLNINMSDDKKTIKGSYTVSVFSKEEPIAEFICDVAKSTSEKIAGLQIYNQLSASAGLLFPYANPQNVIYHMGAVQFPIDIVFISDKKIKKICKNIEPGTLGTFGCANISDVLEIRGGLSDHLGLAINNCIEIKKLKKSRNIDRLCIMANAKKKAIIKYSSIARSKVSNWNGFPVFTENLDMRKSASMDSSVSSLLNKFPIRKERTIFLFIDGLLDSSPNIKVFKKADNDIVFNSLNGRSVFVKENGVVRFDKLKMEKDEVLLSGFKSFNSFISANNEYRKIYYQLLKYLREDEFDNNIVLASRKYNLPYLKNLVESRFYIEFGPKQIFSGFEYFPEKNHIVLSGNLISKYGKNTIIVADDSFQKESGVPIPDDIKQKAKIVYKILSDAESMIEESQDNIKKNHSIYDKISDNLEQVAGSKGQYHQSVKRQSEIVKKYLIKIRDGLRTFDEIKDISTSIEIIDSIAGTSKNAAEAAEEVFDLIDYIEDARFMEMLTEKTGAYEAACDDLSFAIDRAKEYINQHILGLTILSK